MRTGLQQHVTQRTQAMPPLLLPPEEEGEAGEEEGTEPDLAS
jgi:hypothetical protein